MRPGQLINIRNNAMAELLVRVKAGAPVTTVCAQPDMPTHHTLLAWRRKYPTFAEALAEAQRVGLDRRKWGFNEGRAEAFLARLRAGEGVREILDQAGSPMSVAVYKHWTLTQAPFGEEVRRLIAERRRRTVRRVLMAFDQAVADRIVLAIANGLRMQDLGPAVGLPSLRIVKRWRKAQPDFDLGLRTAVRVRLRRASMARGPSPDLLDQILDRVREGDSLRALSKRPGMPSELVLHTWRKLNPDLDRELEQARWERGDLLSDRIMELSETEAMAWANRREVRGLMKRLRRLEARAAARDA